MWHPGIPFFAHLQQLTLLPHFAHPAILLNGYRIVRDMTFNAGRPESTWGGCDPRAALSGWGHYLSLGLPAAAMIWCGLLRLRSPFALVLRLCSVTTARQGFFKRLRSEAPDVLNLLHPSSPATAAPQPGVVGVGADDPLRRLAAAA